MIIKNKFNICYKKLILFTLIYQLTAIITLHYNLENEYFEYVSDNRKIIKILSHAYKQIYTLKQ